jgi:signal transduction histidine kinase/ActR/RegA family two-component response regulator
MRLSIARSLRLALIALTIVLAAVAYGGVASLYRSRQTYEKALVRTSATATAQANLTSTAIGETEVLNDARGRAAPAQRQRARLAFDRAAAIASRQARSDAVTERLLARELTEQRRVRRLADHGRPLVTAVPSGPLAQSRRLADQVQRRQQQLESTAAADARSDAHAAIAVVVTAGVLTLVGALALIGILVRSMRKPLDELVGATRELASGVLTRRVKPSGPRELRALADSFNAMAEDLTSAQSRIEDERRRLAATIESLGDGLLVTEPDSNAIATTNPRATELVPELGPGDRIDATSSPLPDLDAALDHEITIDHEGRTLTVSAALLGDEADGVVWTLHDMTERARLERAKSDFVAYASHELRSPLTSIKGFVELLGRNPERLDARQREFIDIILRSTDRLVELVNDLLDVARIEADSVEIARRPIDIGEALREVAELMGPRINEKDQQLGVYVAPALPLAMADPVRIRQIIHNLLTNAHLYTDRGGRIHLGAEADRAWVRIVVSDSGVGMSAAEREHIFERFYRARGGDASIPGTGLGLSIVKSLVELHGGQIEVESQPGRGTTFHVLIPAAVPSSDSEQALELLRGRRVLIVDDEPEIAALVADQLRPLEVSAAVALGGREALQRLRSESFDAITLDILMPGMDGFAILAELRADPELRSIPIVFVSVFAGREELAGEWVVAKPIDADELREVLAAAVRAGRSRVLVVGRPHMQVALEPALDELGIEHQWETTGAAAARVCGERRFEVALIDIGIRNPQAALQALDLRGRRLRRAVILFSDDDTPTPGGLVKLGTEVVPLQGAAQALLRALGEDARQSSQEQGWTSEAKRS